MQAQQLRSRVEMRVNRIPTALRRLKMGDLLAKHSETEQQRPRSAYVAKPPPVPAKDGTSPKPIPRKPVSSKTQRGQKRLRYDMMGWGHIEGRSTVFSTDCDLARPSTGLTIRRTPSSPQPFPRRDSEEPLPSRSRHASSQVRSCRQLRLTRGSCREEPRGQRPRSRTQWSVRLFPGP